MSISSIIRCGVAWVDTHQKFIRTTAVVVGAASTIATPFLAAKATTNVARKIREANAETKEEKMKIARTDPWVWATCATTISSLGCGALTYGLSERVIKKTESIMEKTVDQLDSVTQAVSSLPEKDQEKINKAVAENKYEKQVAKEESGEYSIVKNAPIETGYGNTLFYDTWTNTYFLSDYNKVMSVINEMNDEHNHAVTTNCVADWCIKNGFSPKQDIAYDYFFTTMIELVKDGDHFYQIDDKGNPLGILEFTVNSQPKHLSRSERERLPFI